ncbi:MAG: hypothetical protein HY611_07535 [Elusimicrobia bacterium]|nr:hypothetical protein [Elusimicrobiota bacterium]
MLESSRRVRAFEAAAATAAIGLAFLVNFYAGRYVHRLGARLPSLNEDLLLHALPRMDLTVLFVWGFAAFLVFAAAAALLTERGRIPYVLWMYALLISMRGMFIMLTPMGTPSGMFPIEDYTLFNMVGRYLTFKNDLFFSAHTSMPFLGFLIYRRGWVRIVFLAGSIAMGFCVLLSRLHYSIDVIGAYFITYAVVRIHQEIFEMRYAKWKKRWG